MTSTDKGDRTAKSRASESESSEVASLSLLMAGVQWQDELLQSYRAFHVTLQSLLLATGAALTVGVFSIRSTAGSIVSAGILTAIGTLAVSISWKIQGVVLARGQDVNWWHCKLIEQEELVPPEQRYLTAFKIHQKLRRTESNHLEELLTLDRVRSAKAEDLVGRQLGHTRKVLDRWLFVGVRTVWGLLLGSSLIYTAHVHLNLF